MESHSASNPLPPPGKKRSWRGLSRRLFVKASIGSATTGLVAGWYMKFFEPGNFEITTKNIAHCFRGGIQSGLRILHLSDFHSSSEVPLKMIERAVDLAMEKAAPCDVAFLTGDFITWRIDQPGKYKKILKKISSSMPAYACLGNHDGGLWAGKNGGYPTTQPIKEFLESCDIPVLFNEAREITIRNQPVKLIGLGDLWARDHKPESVMPSISAEGNTPFDLPVIVLSHNPDMKIAMEDKYEWDLMLSGHTHGGQLVIPFMNYRPFIPVYDTSHPEGLAKWHGRRWIHISRGIGNRHGLRFNCRPEISILTT